MSTQSSPQQNRNIYDGSIVIPGDEELYQSLHVLKQRGYTVILAKPPGIDGLTALKNAGRFFFECPCSCKHNDSTWVQPGDVNGLKRQLVSLLESSGGQLPLERLRDTYRKTFKRPLIVKDYYHMTLMNLLADMSDEIEIIGEDQNRLMHSKKCLDQKLDVFRNELQEILGCCFCRISLTSFERSYQEMYNRSLDYQSLGVSNLEELLVKMGDMVVLVEDRESKEKYVMCARRLQLRREVLKIRLKTLLSSYFGTILLCCFEEFYESRFGYKLDYVKYGVNDLEELCEVLSDILVVEVNPGGKLKLIKVVQ